MQYEYIRDDCTLNISRSPAYTVNSDKVTSLKEIEGTDNPKITN